MDKDFLKQLVLKIKSHSNCSDMNDIKIYFLIFELGLLGSITKEEFLFHLNEWLNIKK